MDETENTFPMDFYVRDSSPPTVEVPADGLPGRDPVGCRRGAAGGKLSRQPRVRHRDVKLYTGNQILENYEVYAGRRNVTDKVVGSFVDDSEGRELYLDLRPSDLEGLGLVGSIESTRPGALGLFYARCTWSLSAD
jgi:hypothetical protein